MTIPNGNKGYAAEEALRCYFVSQGYYVVRSVPFIYKGFEITDIDLWLYTRSSPITCERTCVDIKRKKTPQAMERVFWTKGLREVLGTERAIVVTTDNRKETEDLGAMLGINVLNGVFLQDVINGFTLTGRITEEDLFASLKAPCVVEPHVVWARWFRNVKAKLIGGLNFNACNKFLLDIRLLIQEYIATGRSFYPVVRMLYIVISFFLISIEYASCSFAHLKADERKRRIDDGLRYGEVGKERTEEIVNMALHLLDVSKKTDLFSQNHLKLEFQRQLSEYPAEIIGEYFAKSEHQGTLFRLAREFAEAAYASTVVVPHNCPPDHKAIIGLLCDFSKIHRKDVI